MGMSEFFHNKHNLGDGGLSIVFLGGMGGEGRGGLSIFS